MQFVKYTHTHPPSGAEYEKRKIYNEKKDNSRSQDRSFYIGLRSRSVWHVAAPIDQLDRSALTSLIG